MRSGVLTLLPPGISEDPESPFHIDQMDLWVKGATHPAPLARAKVEQLASSRITLTASTAAPAGRGLAPPVVTPAAARFVAAIPANVKPPLPGRKPDDPVLEAGLRYLIRPERTADQAAAKARELKAYVAGRRDLHAQLVSGLRLVLHLEYGNAEAKAEMRGLLREIAGAPTPRASR